MNRSQGSLREISERISFPSNRTRRHHGRGIELRMAFHEDPEMLLRYVSLDLSRSAALALPRPTFMPLGVDTTEFHILVYAETPQWFDEQMRAR